MDAVIIILQAGVATGTVLLFATIGEIFAERSGVLKEFKKRAYFTKPSVKKRLKKVKAIRRAQRALAEQM